MKVMITCNEATNMVSKKEEEKLSFMKKIQLRYHLLICSFCKLFYRQNTIIITNASFLDKHIEGSLSPEEKEKMIAVVEASGGF